MKLTVLSPQKQIVCVTNVVAVELPSIKGRFVVLKGHAPVIAALQNGIVRYKLGNEEFEIQIRGGFAEVKDDEITVCSD